MITCKSSQFRYIYLAFLLSKDISIIEHEDYHDVTHVCLLEPLVNGICK